VLIGAALLAEGVELGLTVKKHVKTSLAPGPARADYLTKAGLLPTSNSSASASPLMDVPLASANAGPLAETIDDAIVKNDLVCAAVLSATATSKRGIHPNIRRTSSRLRRWWLRMRSPEPC